MDEEFILETPEQIQALGHPTRQRILRTLGTTCATNKQIASALREPPARIHFHVRELLSAGLIEIVLEQPKGGVLEKYYRAVAKSFRLGTSFSADDAVHRHALWDSILVSAHEELRFATNLFSGKPPQMLSVHVNGQLSSDAVTKVRHYLDLIRQEFENGAAGDDPKNFVLTFMMHETKG